MKPLYRRGPYTSAAALIAMSAVLAGCQPAVESAQKDPVLVDVVTAASSTFASHITLTGEIQANTTSDLAFQTSGKVLERFVDVGDRVIANQLLARVSSSEQIADRDAAQAALDVALFGLNQANTDLGRQKDLLAGGFTNRSAYDAAVEAQSTAESRVKTAQADYDRSLEALDQTELRAFASGTVTARQIETGQVVQAGQPAFTVAADGPREAVFEVDEGVLTDTFAAQNFTVKSTGNTQVTATAHLTEVSPTIDKTSGSVEIKLALSDAPADMSLGSVVTTSGQYSSVNAVVVPAAALTSDNGQPAVWILDPASLVVSRHPVELSVFDNSSLVILSGVTPGDLVVTSGANLIFPGQTVRIKQQP